MGLAISRVISRVIRRDGYDYEAADPLELQHLALSDLEETLVRVNLNVQSGAPALGDRASWSRKVQVGRIVRAVAAAMVLVILAAAAAAPTAASTAEDAGAAALLTLAIMPHSEAIQADLVAIAKAAAIPPLVALMRDGTDQQKPYAAAALGKLAGSAGHLDVAIAKAGGIPPLVALICDGNAEQKEIAAAALLRLAHSCDDNKIAIAKAGGIPPLVALVRDGNVAQKQTAAAALRDLVENADNKIAIAKAGGIPPLVALIRDGNEAQKQHAAVALQLLAANTDNQILIAKAKIEAGIWRPHLGSLGVAGIGDYSDTLPLTRRGRRGRFDTWARSSAIATTASAVAVTASAA